MNANLIEVPTIRQIQDMGIKALALSKCFNREGREIFDEAASALNHSSRAKHDEALAYKLRNLPRVLDGFERVIRERGGKDVGRPHGLLRARFTGKGGKVLDFGIISPNLVTNNGVGAIVDILQGLVTATNVKFHASGTTNTAEAQGDSALVAEVETRATGTNAEGASANIYRSVGTQTYTATRAIVEHGIFLASTTGTLFDRSVFSAINVVNGDSIEWTYEVTFSAGG